MSNNKKSKIAIAGTIIAVAGLLLFASRKEKPFKVKKLNASRGKENQTGEIVNNVIDQSREYNEKECQEAYDLYFSILRQMIDEGPQQSPQTLYTSSIAAFIKCRPDCKGLGYLPANVGTMEEFLEINGVQIVR